MSSRVNIFLSIALLSACLMLYEINLIRLYSIMIRNVSFFVLAIALFGYGLGGLYGHFYSQWNRINQSNWRFHLPFLMAVSILVSFIVLAELPLGRAGEEQLPLFLGILTLFFFTCLPFFFGSLYISLIFTQELRKIGALYFVDLAGAALACCAAIPIMTFVGGFSLPFLLTLLGLGIAFLAEGRTRKASAVSATLGVITVVLAIYNAYEPLLRVTPDATKKNPVTLFEKWNFFSYVTVSQTEWTGWRMSENYAGPRPEYLMIRYDGHAPAFIPHLAGPNREATLEAMQWDITALPYYVTDPKKVLVIGGGGGRDIATAKSFGVPEISAVELNPITARDIMRGQFNEYSGGLYQLPGVSIHIDNGRTFTERTTEKYDMVYTSLVDTLLGTSSGIFVLAENHLYTVEAFDSYLDRLTEGGYACILYSALEDGHLLNRMFTTAMEALKKRGVTEPEKHFLAIMTPDPTGYVDEGICLLFSNQEIAPAAIARAEQACQKLGYSLAWPPAATPNRWSRQLQRIFDPSMHPEFIQVYPYDISPLVDNRPYMHYSYKPRDFLKVVFQPGWAGSISTAGVTRLPFLIDMFLVTFLLVFLLMLSPLFLFKREELRRARRRGLAYLSIFFLLGVGFMLVEVALIQHVFLFLGNPTLTFAAILGIMLAFAGVGSLVTRSFPDGRMKLLTISAAAAAILTQLALFLLLPHLMAAFGGSETLVKLLLVVPAVGVVAFPMGMLLPCSLRLMNLQDIHLTAWAWGMNGIGSVIGSVGASLIALNLGIDGVYLLGCALYLLLLSLLVAIRTRKILPVS